MTMKYASAVSCALVLVHLGCSSEDNASAAAGAGGSTSTATGPTGGASLGGSTSSTSSAAGGSAGTVSLPQSAYVGKLMINELVPSNHTGAIDEAGAYPDWLELYNSTTSDIGLSGFYLTDKLDELTRGPLDASLSVRAGGVLLLWADGDIDQGVLHLPFGLSAAGESLYLLDSEQKLVDSVEWGPANADAAYARLPDGTGSFAWCSTGTPNRTNGQACPN
jgi:hypothetical protein